MKKRILIFALALVFLLSSAPALAQAGQRYTSEDFAAALENGELTEIWVDLGGAWMDIADGETQVWLNPCTKVFIDPDEEAPAGYLWIYIYKWFMAIDGTPVLRLVGAGLVDADYMSDEPPVIPSVNGAGYYHEEEHVEIPR